MWKDFFYFSRRERQGILILIVLVASVFLGKFLFTPKVAKPSEIAVELSENSEKPKVIPDRAGDRTIQNRYPSGKQKTLGVSTKTGQSPEQRTYYSQPVKQPVLPKQSPYPISEKFSEGTVIEINKSDTLQLMKIPGIGAAFAKRIAGYRNLLGGFYRLEQLQEVYGMYEELYEKIVPYLRMDTNKITPIQVNIASLDKLKAHPYLNFYQAKAIVEMRKKKGKLENINEFSLLEEFTAKDMERIKRYLAF